MKKYFIFLMIGILFLFVAPKLMVSACDDNTCNKTETRTTTPCEDGYSGTITETRHQSAGRHECEWSDWTVKSNTCTINTYVFTVNMDGTGTGTVSGGGTFNYGTTEHATAQAAEGSTFEAWNGNCDDNGYVFMDGPKTCTATFIKNETPVEKFTVTATAGTNGTITPATQEATSGAPVTLTVTPDSGYTATVAGTCPAGTLVGTTYTTGNIMADCNVAATFTQIPANTFTVTATAGDNGIISPASQQATPGTSVTLTVTPSVGYIATVGGTCGGNLVDTTYTTASINADCTVVATFSQTPVTTYTVTASAGANGAISPATQQAATGTTVVFTVTPNSGYTATVAGTCPAGALVGTTYTTGSISADCTVEATFTLKPTDTDVCPNIDGIQTTVPSGMILSNSGHCQKHSSGGSSGSSVVRTPQVLGTQSTCGIYVDKYMRKGLKGNDTEAVKKVQIFLNSYLNSGLKVDGIFGTKTDIAVRAFQAQHQEKVLTPWGLTGPTGIFYLTTQTEVNNIMCPPLNLPIPTLVPMNQNPSFPQF